MDEADKMVELELEESVGTILGAMGDKNLASLAQSEPGWAEEFAKRGTHLERVMHMYSATMPHKVERMARSYLRAPIYISIGEPGSGKKEIL